MVLRSDLQGIASSLPAPFNKSATEKWPQLSLDPLRRGRGPDLGLSLGDKLKAEVMRRRSDARWLLARGGVAWNETLRQADGGILVSANLPVLDVDAWLKAIDSGDAPASADAVGDGSQWPLSALTLQADALQVLGERLGKVVLKATADAGGWKGSVSSPAVEGSFDWRQRDEGTLQARLSRLAVDPVEKAGSAGPRRLRATRRPGVCRPST